MFSLCPSIKKANFACDQEGLGPNPPMEFTWDLWQMEGQRSSVYVNLTKPCLVIQAVPFSSPSWRSLNPLKGSLNHPKKVTLNHLVPDFLFILFVICFCHQPFRITGIHGTIVYVPDPWSSWWSLRKLVAQYTYNYSMENWNTHFFLELTVGCRYRTSTQDEDPGKETKS